MATAAINVVLTGGGTSYTVPANRLIVCRLTGTGFSNNGAVLLDGAACCTVGASIPSAGPVTANAGQTFSIVNGQSNVILNGLLFDV